MLRVTIEFLPNGDESRKRELARASIGNVKRGALAKYRARLREGGIDGEKMVEIEDYPRWSSLIWDLVVRCIAKSLTGNEELPPRPKLLQVPIHEEEGFSYVKLADIPEPARSAFLDNLGRSYSSRPIIDGAETCAFARDWREFQAGER